MKRPEYVAAVTAVYRQALDSGSVTPQMMGLLHKAFNRQGFTDGYYTDRPGKDMFGIREENAGDERWYRQIRQTYEGAENGLVPIIFRAKVTPQRFTLTAIDPEGRACMLEGMPPEPARVAELTRELLISRLSKTGGTPYYCSEVEADVAPGLTLSAAAINGLRRDVLNQLTAQRARRDIPRLGRPGRTAVMPGNRHHPVLTAQVTTREQITERLLKTAPAVLYVPIHILADDPEFCRGLARRVSVCAVLPRIVHDKEIPALKQTMTQIREQGVRQVLAGNLGLLVPAQECGMELRGDFGLNLYNSGAVNTARQMELLSATLSFEMTLPQIRDVSKAVPCEILCYGRLPLMVTENCLFRGRTGQCTCQQGVTKLTDKTGAEFPVLRDGSSCRSVLLNGKKLNWLDRLGDLSRLGLWATRLYFTTENSREVDLVLGALSNPPEFDPGACTRGLYLRGVE